MRIGKQILLAIIASLATCESTEISPATKLQDAMHSLGRRLGVEEEIACTTDENCPDFYICGDKNVCGHKGIFPVESLEIGGIIVFAVVMALSNIAGIGGGGVAIPIIMAMFVFPTKPAIAISSLSIFLTTLMRFFMNFRERHPSKDNVVVIDYDLVAIMMPTTLAGAQIGAVILVTFPAVIILMMLTILLGFLSVQSTFKAIKLTKQENDARGGALAQVKPVAEVELTEQPSAVMLKKNDDLSEIQADEAADAQDKGTDRIEDERKALTPGKPSDEQVDNLDKKISLEAPELIEQDGTDEYFDQSLKIRVDKSMNQKELSQLRRSVKAESSHFQWAKQGLCITLLAALILMNLMMGSSNMDSIVGLKKCDGAYWGIQIFFLAICVLGTIAAVKMAQRDQALKLKYGGINLTESDIRYDDKKRLIQLLCLGFVGGWVAGALGLGGGCVYNPALLALGIPPKVSSASGLYLVTFSKMASVLIYYLNDQLNIPYGLWIGLWSCVGMAIGLLATQYYMKKTGRQSIIVWCLVIIFIISTVAVPIFGALSLSDEMDEGLELWGFGSLCADKKK